MLTYYGLAWWRKLENPEKTINPGWVPPILLYAYTGNLTLAAAMTRETDIPLYYPGPCWGLNKSPMGPLKPWTMDIFFHILSYKT